MSIAVNHIIEIGGGQCVVKDGKIISEIAYPICGLLTDLSAKEVAEKKNEINNVIHSMGCQITIPFMFLSFICLSALPTYAITDHGFINVLTHTIENPILEVVE